MELDSCVDNPGSTGKNFTKTNSNISSILREGADWQQSGSYGKKEQGWLVSQPSPSKAHSHRAFLPGMSSAPHARASVPSRTAVRLGE